MAKHRCNTTHDSWPPLEPPCSPSTQTRWRRSTEVLADDLESYSKDWADDLDRAQAELVEPTVTLTFGGHFKSGKSSLMNEALGRPVLPVDDLPETGAVCVVEAAADDRAEVAYEDGGWESVACDTDSIRAITSLTGADGRRSDAVHTVDRLRLGLEGVAVPAGFRWIDSPGINDDHRMDDRAWAAAIEADVLVWVLTSRQLLSETEVGFLADFVARRGAAALQFVVNAFLRDDTEAAWQRFLADKMPAHLERLYAAAPRLGLGDPALATPIPPIGS